MKSGTIFFGWVLGIERCFEGIFFGRDQTNIKDRHTKIHSMLGISWAHSAQWANIFSCFMRGFVLLTFYGIHGFKTSVLAGTKEYLPTCGSFLGAKCNR